MFGEPDWTLDLQLARTGDYACVLLLVWLLSL